jgi:hypothetical protein
MNVTRCFGGVRLGPHAPEGVLWIQAERGRAECRMLATIWRRQTSRLKSGRAPSDLGGDRLRVRRIHGRGANCARDGSQSIGAGYGCGDRLKDLYNSQRYVRRLIPVSRRKVFEMSGQPSRKPPHAGSRNSNAASCGPGPQNMAWSFAILPTNGWSCQCGGKSNRGRECFKCGIN